jgi:uncharacterized protein YyaL (SSP411 family)
VWSESEAQAALDRAGLEDEAGPVLDHLGVSAKGNWEGTNVLHLRHGAWAEPPPRFEEARAALLQARAERVRPGLDDKRLTSWNALMIGALAEAGAALGREDFLDAADACADFLLEKMRDERGRLLRTYNRERAHLNAYLEDHAYLLEALLALYQARFDPTRLEAAEAIAAAILGRFADPDGDGFFTTSADHERLITRRKDVEDHPIPSGNSSAARGLLQLGALTGDGRWIEAAEGTLRMLAGPAERHPQALAYVLCALELAVEPPREVALIAPTGAGADALTELAGVVRSAYRPRVVLAGGSEGDDVPALLAERPALDGGPAAYVCERFACKRPVATAAELEALLAGS